MNATEAPLGLATAADAGPIARMARDEIERGLGWRWQPPAIARLIAAENTTVLCARQTLGDDAAKDGELPLAGFGVMEFGERQAHLVLLAVAPRLRRQGVASRILAWLEKSARTAGLTEVLLEVRADNRGAQRFYATFGFRRRRYLPGFYQGREAAYRMAKALVDGTDDGRR